MIKKLKTHFARYGCPNQVVSDNGPQFACDEFAKFAVEWDFDHTHSSPAHSKSNGKAESAVKTAKKLLRKAKDAKTDPYLAILDCRNTPTQGIDSSPAQRLMNRRTKTLLPMVGELLKPRDVQRSDEKEKLELRQKKQAEYYNRSAKDLQPLKEGEKVRMKLLQYVLYCSSVDQ